MMKVFPHAAFLIPLSIFLLLVLPYEVNGRSRQKQLKEEEKKKDEYETGRIRKRDSSMKLSEHFKGDNLAKACSVCHKLYDIDEGNCVAGTRRAKYNCMVKAKENRDSFKAKFHESESPPSAPAPESAPSAPAPESAPAPSPSGGGGSPPSGDDLFKPEYLEKTCRICGKIGGVNEDECKSDQNRAREYCKMTTTEMKKKFNDNWEAGGDSSDEDDTSQIGKRDASMKLSEHFKGDNLAKACTVCHTLYDIDEGNCVAGTRRAKYNCMVKAKENSVSFKAKFHESESPPSAPAPESTPPAPTPSPSGGEGQSQPAAETPKKLELPGNTDDLFKSEYVQKTCKVCQTIVNTNVDQCVQSADTHDRKCCVEAVKVMKEKFDSEWNKISSKR